MKRTNKERVQARKRNRIRLNTIRNRQPKVAQLAPVFLLVLVKVDIDNKTPEQVRDRLDQHASALTGNGSFPTPEPTIAELQALYLELKNLIKEAAKGYKVAKTERDSKTVEGKTAIRTLGNYVQLKSGGDKAKIESAAFLTVNPPTQGQIPVQVTNVKAKPGELTCTIAIKWKSQYRKSRLYVIEMTENLSQPFVAIGQSTKAKFLVTGLTPGKTYYFRVFAINNVGTGPVSDLVQQMSL